MYVCMYVYVYVYVCVSVCAVRSWWNRHVQNPIKFHGYQGE